MKFFLASKLNLTGLVLGSIMELVEKQMSGTGAMIAFGVQGGLEGAKNMISSVRLCTLAVSLGGVETLIEHPASMTHAGMSPADRAAAGIREDLVRLAVGCEAVEDLQKDLEQALAANVPVSASPQDGGVSSS